MDDISLGTTYHEMFLTPRNGQHILQHMVTEKHYGFFITKITAYVTVHKTRLIINENGSAKSTTRVDKNYHKPYQYTLYFDKEGREIKGKSTRAELKYYKSLQ